MNNSTGEQYFVVEFCLFNEESVRNLIASLYLHFHLDFTCIDFCMSVKGRFPRVFEQMNAKSTNSEKFLNCSEYQCTFYTILYNV